MYAVQYTVHVAERNPLSRERIIDAAVGLLEQDGWDALSMRRLAQELDVWPMAVYRYFRDKEELVDALVEHAAAGMEPPDSEADPWESMRALLEAARDTLGRLPAELRGRLGSRMVAPGRAGPASDGREILESAGFEPDEAQTAWSALGAYAIGAVEIDDDGFGYGLDRLLEGLEREAGALR